MEKREKIRLGNNSGNRGFLDSLSYFYHMFINSLIDGGISMNEQMTKTIENIEKNISHCYILNRLLDEIRKNGGSIDYEHFYNNGYDKYEVYLGVQLIELYMMLKKCIDQVSG